MLVAKAVGFEVVVVTYYVDLDDNFILLLEWYLGFGSYRENIVTNYCNIFILRSGVYCCHNSMEIFFVRFLVHEGSLPNFFVYIIDDYYCQGRQVGEHGEVQGQVDPEAHHAWILSMKNIKKLLVTKDFTQNLFKWAQCYLKGMEFMTLKAVEDKKELANK